MKSNGFSINFLRQCFNHPFDAGFIRVKDKYHDNAFFQHSSSEFFNDHWKSCMYVTNKKTPLFWKINLCIRLVIWCLQYHTSVIRAPCNHAVVFMAIASSASTLSYSDGSLSSLPRHFSVSLYEMLRLHCHCASVHRHCHSNNSCLHKKRVARHTIKNFQQCFNTQNNLSMTFLQD